MPVDVIHPVLGTMSLNTETSNWETKVELRPGWTIDIRIPVQRDEAPMDGLEELLNGGAVMLAWARRTERACRERIADDLLETYNDIWAPEDATTPMIRAEMIDRVVPNSLVRDIDGSGFMYWDDDLFAGHLIEVRFDSDLTITEVGLAG
jgi:hypothetical protein